MTYGALSDWVDWDEEGLIPDQNQYDMKSVMSGKE